MCRPIQFETDSFVGSAAIWVRDLPTATADMWKGKRRRSRIAIQGRFKCGAALASMPNPVASSDNCRPTLSGVFHWGMHGIQGLCRLSKKLADETAMLLATCLLTSRAVLCLQGAHLHGGCHHRAGVLARDQHARPLARRPGKRWHHSACVRGGA